MRTKLLFLLLFSLGLAQVSAQMSVASNGNLVTFTFDDANDMGEWDANGNPIYLYLYVNASDTSNNMFSEPLGNWPGTILPSVATDIYEITIDLSNFYPPGTTINEINYIFNNNLGNQNPSSGGFSAVTAGFVPITTLSTLDFENTSNSFTVVNGYLHATKHENVSLFIYNLKGQLVNRIDTVNIDSNSSVDLSLDRNTLYFVRIVSEQGIKTIKTIF